jgi:hypothetical protein
VDFSFIYDELKNKYCLNNGRKAELPIVIFKRESALEIAA